MIVLFTDYGRNGPYTGLLQAALKNLAPQTPVIDLLASAPAYNIKASAYLLAAFTHQFPAGSIFVAVVDPGVGGDRLPVVAEVDSQRFVGPLNGLFDVIINRASQVNVQEIDTSGFQLSASFHGRDIFAPVAAMLAQNEPVPVCGPVRCGSLHTDWLEDYYKVIYIDDFGNAFTAIKVASLDQNSRLDVLDREISYARTFSDVQQSDVFWYGNSLGLVEISVREGSAEKALGLEVGTMISIKTKS